MARKAKALRIPNYCFHKPTGQAYVCLGGRFFYLGKYRLTADGKPDCPRYHELIAEWIAGRTTPTTGQNDAGNPVVPAARELTVEEVVAKFWEHSQTYYKLADGSQSTEVEAFRQALRPLRRLFGGTPAKDFGPKRLKAVREEMVRLGWCRSNVNRQAARVRQVFRWATEEELIPATVLHALKAVRGLRKNPDEVKESAPVKPVPEHAVDAVRPQCRHKWRRSSTCNSIPGCARAKLSSCGRWISR
ncbi:MAG TPA: hypothetical protein VHQ47_07565 [Phycisphaerae bacterium]|jgi:hypothetical protein|nr:hypothetical protein [Phycisphaerae bacterium]